MADSQHLSLLVFDSFCDGPVEWLLVMPDLYLSDVESYGDPMMVFDSQTALYLQNRVHSHNSVHCTILCDDICWQPDLTLAEKPLLNASMSGIFLCA